MYALECDGCSQPTLRQVWQVKASIRPAEDKVQSARLKEGPAQVASLDAKAEHPSAMPQSALEYNYGNTFQMAEITPDGNTLAVEERQGLTTLLKLFSPEGALLRSRELLVEGLKPDLPTLVISGHSGGVYAIGVQGGFVVLVNTESLETERVIKTVSQIECYVRSRAVSGHDGVLLEPTTLESVAYQRGDC